LWSDLLSVQCITALDRIYIYNHIRSPISDIRYPVSILRPECDKLQMVITQQHVIRSRSCLVQGAVFGDGGSNGAISGCFKSKMAASGHFEKNVRWPYHHRHPIYFVFSSRLGFLARIALFNFTAHELHELYYDRPTS